MNDDIELKIRTIIAGVANADDPTVLSAESDLYQDLGVKSTSALDLLLTLEEEFDVQIPDDAFGDARTVTALVALIGDLQ